ncbi:SDR family NAD(P)-dependent oxidoreductase [Kineococcus rhizosphaerae]|uniref:Short-subunit dehydrogenase n=1 Tax=Kineococcus rhizosphaerae TaxID=559628 RepID=A0A2T0R043_9ACTN|nr:SDR family NAD(P)-dependent oxidoreductase [Kineococcus rhizosphaerae]PRY12499.1 short-subunit dehydrogenase [Kineococcus rhizosphaerae]
MTPPDHPETVVLTGGTSGIGLATARALAARGDHVVLAVRDPGKGHRAAQTLAAGVPGTVDVRRLDLADLASVRAFADDLPGTVDVLVNNAGRSVPTLQRTPEGRELQFATNHLGHFALTNLLLPRIRRRVVTVSSRAERAGRLDDVDFTRTRYRPFRAYATSKLANLVFTHELQRRLAATGSAVTATAAHPGYVATGMTGADGGWAVRHLAQSPEQGAWPTLLALDPATPGGTFTGPRRWLHMRGEAVVIDSSRRSLDPGVAERLWRQSEEFTGVRFPG